MNTSAKELVLGLDPCLAELESFRQKVKILHQVKVEDDPEPGSVMPFLIVTPLGMPHQQELSALLSNGQIQVASREVIRDWPTASSAVYVRELDNDSLTKAMLFETLWRDLFEQQTAELWRLASIEDYDRLTGQKRDLRQQLPALQLQVLLPRSTWMVGLHPFHVPDLDRLVIEFGRIKPWMEI